MKKAIPLIAVGAALVLAGAGCGGSAPARAHGSTSPRLQGSTSPRVQGLLFLRVHEGFSPSERFFLWRSGSPAKPVGPVVNFAYAFAQWSPDGRSIAFEQELEGSGALGAPSTFPIYVMRSDGKKVRMLTDDSENVVLSWSPDGRQIVYERSDGLVIVDVPTGHERTLPGAFRGVAAAWGEPGIAYVDSDRGIKLMNPRTGRSLFMAHGDFRPGLAWSPSGVLAVHKLNRILFLSPSGRVLGQLPQRPGYVEDFEGVGPGCSPVWSPNGKQILETANSGVVWIGTLSTKHWQRLNLHADGCVVGWR